MASEDSTTSRRLARLRRRPALDTKSDDFLLLCLEESADFFLDYTNRSKDPGEPVDNLICELATLKAQTEGVENMASASEGGISRSYFPDIPPFFKNRLNNWRLIRGLQSATDDGKQ